MEFPNVVTPVTDRVCNVEYRFLAYRELSADEARQQILLFRQQKLVLSGAKRPHKTRQVIEIRLTIGANE